MFWSASPARNVAFQRSLGQVSGATSMEQVGGLPSTGVSPTQPALSPAQEQEVPPTVTTLEDRHRSFKASVILL